MIIGNRRSNRCRLWPSRAVALALALLGILVLATLLLVTVSARTMVAVQPTWLEPRGLSVVEMVGQVPEEHLAGAILSYGDGDGIVVYDSGRRTGDTVIITTTLYPRLVTVPWVPRAQLTQFGCLGQSPHYDHLGSVVPGSTLRVYDGAEELTDRIVFMTISDMDVTLPLAGSDAPFRYPVREYGQGRPYSLPLDSNGLHIPANSGCAIGIPGEVGPVLTGVFRLSHQPSAEVRLLGTQQATFHSYIGPGWVGIFQPLLDQLLATYGSRHERILLKPPADAD
ncbi:MAG TPA: hypothetical protein VLC52_11020, partial [Anaerolineae bacterium]|nr:hypothetical protein [Anaerolineae bacterium]